jgi:NAD-dependent DNA ligase
VPEISLIPKRKATDLADLQRRVIEMLPGCGLTIARDLLQRFGSVQRIVNATKDELRTIHGIGDKRAAEIHQVLHAEYASVDTEKDLEDAIAVAPELLFERPVSLLARQHYICTRAGERYVIDLVFADEAANDLILVELKRGQLARKHEEQLLRYMDHADESPLLRARTRAGAQLRGMLATVTRNSYRAQGGNIAVRIVDRQRTIEVLKRLRRQGIKANQAQDMRMGQSTAIGSAGHTEDSG